MYKKIKVLVPVFTLTISAAIAGQQQAPDTISGPVEMKPPNSDYTPAFGAQTRVGRIKTTSAYQGKLLSSDLKSPWGIAMLPDGRFLITEKRGQMRIATPEGQVSEPVTGLPEVNPAGQGGLLGLAIDPEFGTNRMVYWLFSEKTRSEERRVG